MSSATKIEPGSGVTLYFSLALPGGEVIDSNFDAKPASFRVGDGNMLPGFESRLLGLQTADEAEFRVPAEEAFGPVNADNLQRMSRQKFRLLLDDEYAALKAGDVVSFRDAGGFDIPGVIKEISSSSALVDFNHPLAGRDILFRVRIVNVLPVEAKAIDIKF